MGALCCWLSSTVSICSPHSLLGAPHDPRSSVRASASAASKRERDHARPCRARRPSVRVPPRCGQPQTPRVSGVHLPKRNERYLIRASRSTPWSSNVQRTRTQQPTCDREIAPPSKAQIPTTAGGRADGIAVGRPYRSGSDWCRLPLLIAARSDLFCNRGLTAPRFEDTLVRSKCRPCGDQQLGSTTGPALLVRGRAVAATAGPRVSQRTKRRSARRSAGPASPGR
jgi:hypothetical protein